MFVLKKWKVKSGKKNLQTDKFGTGSTISPDRWEIFIK
jgi:hypothetical protein